MPGSIDQIDVIPVPRTFRRGRSNRDASLLLFLHKIHNRGSVMNFADFMGLSAEIQNAFCHRRLARIDVSHDADISNFGQNRCHEAFLLYIIMHFLRA
jgi:hypothetical protein